MEWVLSWLEGPAEPEVELVERKGLGHPDTLCDAVAEALSLGLCRYDLEHFGRILHHNVDKALLVGGAASPRFGGGEVLAPMALYLAGRATARVEGHEVPLAAIAQQAVRTSLSRLHALDVERHVVTHPLIRPGSEALTDLFERRRAGGAWAANDSSFGAGYAPLSALERLVLGLERRLNAPDTKRERPAWGEDVKVTGLRVGRRVELTIACAMVDRFVPDAAAYEAEKAAIAELARALAAERADWDVTVAVNAADDPSRGAYYLSVTGTSAEAGDDGEVGRGNRANGLITPYRPMTLEALAGKNPMSHVGKLYNLLAMQVAEALVAALPELGEARCFLASRIGEPIASPRLLHVQARAVAGRPAEGAIRAIAEAELGRVSALWTDLLAGRLSLA